MECQLGVVCHLKIISNYIIILSNRVGGGPKVILTGLRWTLLGCPRNVIFKEIGSTPTAHRQVMLQFRADASVHDALPATFLFK